MSLLRYWFYIGLTVTIAFFSVLAEAQTIGMVADNSSNKVIVFTAETNTVLGSVAIPASGATGDVLVKADQTLGFVTNFGGLVWVIDLTASPPALAAGTNPIPISNPGEDLSITPDQNFLLVGDGSAVAPLSVINIATRTQIGTFSLGSDHNSVEIGQDGSVLVTSFNTSNLYRLLVDGTGTLTNTGDVLGGGSPMNAYPAPGDASGIVVDYFTSTVRSFTIPGLSLVNSRSLGGNGICAVINPAGNLVYVRTFPPNTVVVFAFNPLTGALGTTPQFTIPVGSAASSFFGMDQMALSPDGTKLYVPRTGGVDVFDASNGNLLTTITHPDIVSPSGIAFRSGAVAPPGSISGKKFHDFNGNGIDDGEPGLQGWTINLTGPVTGTTTTDANGNYTFTGLAAGTYTLTEVLQGGWTPTFPPPLNPITPGAQTVVLGSGANVTGVNFGNRLSIGRGTIRGMVYDDRNGNGKQDAGEPGFSAMRVFANGGSSNSETLSDPNGEYAFSNIPSGGYRVSLFLPSGWQQTQPAGGQPYNLTLAAGATMTGIDFGARIVTSVEEAEENPKEYHLYQNYPNPFNPSTRLTYSLPNAGYVTLKIFNLLGVELATVVEGWQSAGTHSVVWDAEGLPSGVYIYRLTAGNFVGLKKMILMR